MVALYQCICAIAEHCVNTGTAGRLIFGSGTKLLVHIGE